MKQIGAGNNFTYKVYDNFLEESVFRMLEVETISTHFCVIRLLITLWVRGHFLMQQ